MALSETNLRKLSIAHARGLIDRATYQRLRTAQLSALDFERTPPGLPSEIVDITIPHQKIDPPHHPPLNGASLTLWIIIGIFVLAGAAIAAYLLTPVV